MYSIQYQSFDYTQLNNQTVLFQAIQFSISHLFTFSLNVKQIEPFQVLPLQARVDLGATAIKGYTTFPKTPTLLEPYY